MGFDLCFDLRFDLCSGPGFDLDLIEHLMFGSEGKC